MFGRNPKPKPKPEPKRCCENCHRSENYGPARYTPDYQVWLCGWCWLNSFVYHADRPRNRLS